MVLERGRLPVCSCLSGRLCDRAASFALSTASLVATAALVRHPNHDGLALGERDAREAFTASMRRAFGQIGEI